MLPLLPPLPPFPPLAASKLEFLKYILNEFGNFRLGAVTLDYMILQVLHKKLRNRMTDLNAFSLLNANVAPVIDCAQEVALRILPLLGGVLLAALAVGAAGVRGRRQRVAG